MEIIEFIGVIIVTTLSLYFSSKSLFYAINKYYCSKLSDNEYFKMVPGLIPKYPFGDLYDSRFLSGTTFAKDLQSIASNSKIIFFSNFF